MASTPKYIHSDLEHSGLAESLNLKSATKTPLQYMEIPPKPCLVNLQILKLSSEVGGRFTRGVSSIHELMKKMGVLLNRTTTLPISSHLPISFKIATSKNISCPLPMAERVITSIGTSSHAKGNQTSFCCSLNPTSRGSPAADKEFDFSSPGYWLGFKKWKSENNDYIIRLNSQHSLQHSPHAMPSDLRELPPQSRFKLTAGKFEFEISAVQ